MPQQVEIDGLREQGSTKETLVNDLENETVKVKHHSNVVMAKNDELQRQLEHENERARLHAQHLANREERLLARLSELENEIVHEWGRNEFIERRMLAMQQYITGHRLLGPEFWRNDVQRYVARNHELPNSFYTPAEDADTEHDAMRRRLDTALRNVMQAYSLS